MCIISELCTCYTQNVDNSWISSEFDVVFMWKNRKKCFLKKREEKSKDLIDKKYFFQYNRSDVFQQERKIEGGGFRYEDDISAKEKTEI